MSDELEASAVEVTTIEVKRDSFRCRVASSKGFNGLG
jgi:hypothetical protein